MIGACEVPRKWGLAVALVEEMCSKVPARSSIPGSVPDEHTYVPVSVGRAITKEYRHTNLDIQIHNIVSTTTNAVNLLLVVSRVSDFSND